MVGRQGETSIMRKLLQTSNAEMLVVIGRRRVGKTYLIRSVYKEDLVFDFVGTQFGSMENQLQKFIAKLSAYQKHSSSLKQPENWAEAFSILRVHIGGLRKSKKKRVIFFDEFPWIASNKSKFVQEFSYWWNDWASHQNLLVVICGSAASWMITNIVNHRGGLHNRVTKRIDLQPFTLAETEQFLMSRHVKYDRYQILQLYMSIGGIPQYLMEVNPGESATQAINRICFQKDGTLRTEFDNLYAALYDNYENHVEVVRTLSTKWIGMTRKEVIANTKFTDGGGLTKILDELEASSFIISILPFGKKKREMLYRLSDEYSLFYLKFIENSRAGNKNIWIQKSTDKQYEIWRGYAFETICIKHVEAIKKGLGISGINTNTSSFVRKRTEETDGLQVDMLIDRADKTINLCEMKYYADDLLITQEIADKLRKRRELFRQTSKTRKLLFNTIVTTYGVKKNKHSLSQVDQVITLDTLFELMHF